MSENLERRTLLYVLSEALEKLCRLSRILDNQRVFTPAVETLSSSLEKQRSTFFEISSLVSSYLTGKHLNEAQEKSVQAALNIFISGILRVHELLLLLPRETPRPQASFLLRECFGEPDLKASIVLTNFISAYEYRFEDVLEKVNLEQEEREPLKRGGNVLCQAFADKDNPLAWAVLAHEYGHALDDASGIAHEILGSEADNPPDNERVRLKLDIDTRAVAETVADFVAARVLGPASLMPILFVEMMYPGLKKIENNSAGHPPTPLRVQLVRDYLKSLDVSTEDFGPVFAAYEFDYNRKLSEMKKEDRENIETLGKAAGELLLSKATVIGEKVNALVGPSFSQSNLNVAKILQNTLAATQPISSRRCRTDEDIYTSLSALKHGTTTVEEAYKVLGQLDELPVAASEILTAGWLYRVSSLETALVDMFAGNCAASSEQVASYCSQIEKIDFMLMKSLELVSVYSEIRRA